MRASRSTSQSKPTEASFAPCECHVFNIDDWPCEKGPIRVATCMHICPYCGDDLKNSYSLAVHLQTSNYLERGLVLNWIPMKESELQLVSENAFEMILESMQSFSRETTQLLRSIALSPLPEMAPRTRALWTSSTVCWPRVFGAQDCWLKTAPSAESVLLATINLINEENKPKGTHKEKTANNTSNKEEAALFCRSSNATTHTSHTSTSNEKMGPWKAIAQLHQPNRNDAVAIMGYQLPDVLPNQMLGAPKELNPFNESGLEVFLNPEFYFSDVIMQPVDEIVTVLGPCEQVWLLFPPTPNNLQCLKTDDGFPDIAKDLQGGVIVKIDYSEALYIPAGCIHVSYTVRGGFVASQIFATPKSARAIAGFVAAQFDDLTDFGYDGQEDCLERFLYAVKLAIQNNEVDLGLRAWVDAAAILRSWALPKKGNASAKGITKAWDDFFLSSMSDGVTCPCGKQNKAVTFEEHFRCNHLLEEPSKEKITANDLSAKTAPKKHGRQPTGRPPGRPRKIKRTKYEDRGFAVEAET